MPEERHSLPSLAAIRDLMLRPVWAIVNDAEGAVADSILPEQLLRELLA